MRANYALSYKQSWSAPRRREPSLRAASWSWYGTNLPHNKEHSVTAPPFQGGRVLMLPHATGVGCSRAGPLWSSHSGTSRLARDFAYRLLEQRQNIAFQFQIEHGTCSGVVQLANSPAFHHEDVAHPEAHPADGEGELIRN